MQSTNMNKPDIASIKFERIRLFDSILRELVGQYLQIAIDEESIILNSNDRTSYTINQYD